VRGRVPRADIKQEFLQHNAGGAYSISRSFTRPWPAYHMLNLLAAPFNGGSARPGVGRPTVERSFLGDRTSVLSKCKRRKDRHHCSCGGLGIGGNQARSELAATISTAAVRPQRSGAGELKTFGRQGHVSGEDLASHEKGK